jgi:PAS domain S-box-containing protein
MQRTVLTGAVASEPNLNLRSDCVADSEVAERPHRAAIDEPAIDPSATMNWSNAQWLLHVFRASTAIVLLFQMFYLAADWRWSAAPHDAILPLHLFNIVVSLVFLGVTYMAAYQPRMAQAILVSCSLLFAGTAALAIVNQNSTLLIFTVTITMMGVAALVPWNWRWQTGLAASGATSVAVFTLVRAGADPHPGYGWIALAAAAGAAHYAALAGERYRAEITSRIMALQNSRRQLLEEVAQRAAAVAASEASNQRLRESEAKLRKIFATSADIITINRLSDGRYLDFNQSFERLGYSRREVLENSAGSLGIWARHSQLRAFLREIRITGTVTNFDLDTRAKDGTVYFYQVSATVVELGGEQCVVSICRDVTVVKQIQRELIGAREVMRGQIAKLEQTENLLRAEIRERAAAVAVTEVINQRLRESEAKLRKIFATSSDVITISRQSDGRYLDLNDAFSATGYTAAEALGHTPLELGLWANGEQYHRFLQNLRADGNVANEEMDLRAKNGAVFPYLISATVVELGSETCVVSISRDISAIKETERDLIAAREAMRLHIDTLERTEEQLRAEIRVRTRAMDEREQALRSLAESEGKLRRFFEVSPDSISIVRMADEKITFVNENLCAMSGFEAAELVGKTTRETGIWADPAAFREFSRALNRFGRVRDTDAELRHRNGRLIPHSISAVVAELGGEQYAISVAHDITDRKRVETELLAAREAALAASRAKSEFLSIMSHEIRTPMNAILGLADLLWECDLSSEQRRYLATIRSAGTTLLDLINEILDLAKVESGRLHLEQIPIDLRDLMEKMLETLALRAHSKGLELIGRIAPEAPIRLCGDPLRLHQILFNLAGNAIKFTDSGEVELTIEQTGPPLADTVTAPSMSNGSGPAADDGRIWMRFTVRDTGIGITAMQARTIFSSFTQADSSIARKYGGSGLGLAIVKRLAELMGGAIALESTPGSGSSFTVTVPLVKTAADEQPMLSDAPIYDGAVLAGMRVLIVESCAASRTTLRELLTAAGAVVEEAEDCEGVLKPAKNNSNMVPYNVLLINERMFGSAGIGPQRLAASLGDQASGAGVLIMTTVLPAAEQKEQPGPGFEHRCRHLMKPIKRADLLGAVMEITGRKSPGQPKTALGVQTVPAPGGSAPSPGAALAEARPLRILIADDSPDNRMLIDAYMKKAPFTIDHAEDGSIAVEKFKINQYDLILMDIQMPVMDGYTAVRTIREWERAKGLARIPIIALTASALDESVARSLEAGCDAHISKPVKKSTLLQVILDIAGAAADAASSSAATNEAHPVTRRQIQVDADLRDLVPDFLAHKRDNAGTIRDAIEQADYKTISQIGHKMKGEGGSYGFDEVTAMGAVLEQAAQDRDLATARLTLDEFTAYLDSIDVVYG